MGPTEDARAEVGEDVGVAVGVGSIEYKLNRSVPLPVKSSYYHGVPVGRLAGVWRAVLTARQRMTAAKIGAAAGSFAVRPSV